MGRFELAALGDRLAVGSDNPLSDIKASAVALGKSEGDEHFVAFRGRAQPIGFRAVVAERVVKIARYKAAHDRPSGRAEPDPPRIAGYPGLRECDETRAGHAGLIDQ